MAVAAVPVAVAAVPVAVAAAPALRASPCELIYFQVGVGASVFVIYECSRVRFCFIIILKCVASDDVGLSQKSANVPETASPSCS